MPASADRQAAPASPSSGFTLLEIMATVAILGVLILPMLTVREQASWRAYHATSLSRASHYAEQLLARQMREPTPPASRAGQIEEDPLFRYELLIEDFDLSTGRTEDENEQEQASSAATTSAPLPGDAGVGEGTEDVDDPHKVRRFKISVFWPGRDEDSEESFVLEGFIPRVHEEQDLQ